ncbi:hypothetical protein D806_012350 [Mycolicibacterium smegmatis MKD8]|uniref:Uncharacterized protein n=1 Tax=Mycolicibacterium smegmatis (strain MKD8) TaxID=1214915 RepID=A0A2U9PKE7_MYCSE|nr:hypothetical protein D806_012350 [Mycolicibacterium smegmatis MKD8]
MKTVVGVAVLVAGFGLAASPPASAEPESPWIRRRLELLDSDQGLVGP